MIDTIRALAIIIPWTVLFFSVKPVYILCGLFVGVAIMVLVGDE